MAKQTVLFPIFNFFSDEHSAGQAIGRGAHQTLTIKGESQRCLPMSFADPSIARALEQVRGLRDMLGRVHMKMEKAENALHKMCGESRPHVVPIFLPHSGIPTKY